MSASYSRERLYESGQMEMVDEVIWQQHTYVLEKMPAFGFGIAVSGGIDNPTARTGDTSVMISDVVKNGPAWDKLQVNDQLLQVNSMSMENVTHNQAIGFLKKAGRRVELTVKRKAIVKVPARLGGRSRRYSGQSRKSNRSRQDLTDISPLSPDRADAPTDYHTTQLPVKAAPPETVILSKGKIAKASYGIRLGTRIYIQDVQPGSLADQRGLKSGDIVLAINGIFARDSFDFNRVKLISGKQNQLALVVQKQDGGTVTIPNSTSRPASRPSSRRPSRSRSRTPSRSRSRSPSISKDASPDPPIRTNKDNTLRKIRRSLKKSDLLSGGTKVSKERKEKKPGEAKKSRRIVEFCGLPQSAVALPAMASAVSATVPAVKSYNPTPDFGEYQDSALMNRTAPRAQADEKPRQIIFIKAKNVGIRLAGGNDVGIFVASVQEGSPAAQQGLKMGDQLLEVNGVSFRALTREHAVLNLMSLPIGGEVCIVAQSKPRHYESILERGTGDSFYIRTHFKREPAQSHELGFKKGQVFLITDTLYQGIVGHWLASRIGTNSIQVEKGVIPNQVRADQLKQVEDKKAAQIRAAKTGRGIQAKLFKGKNKGTPAPPAPISGAKFDSYERVVLREAGFKRPVVILGALADISRELLVGDYQDRYEVARNDLAHPDLQQKSRRKGIIKLAVINEIIERNKHAVLDITPTAVDKLNYSQLYPIVIFLKAPSAKVVKDLRQKYSVSTKEKSTSSKKMHERAQKLERGYNFLFTDVIDLAAPDWFTRVHQSIADQQNGLVWVSEKVAAPEEDDENLDQDQDDRLSYVSAPNSEYSVTTIGSEMNRSRRVDDYESEEEDENAEPFQFDDDQQSYRSDSRYGREEPSNSELAPNDYLSKAKSNMRRVPRDPSPELPPPPVSKPPLPDSSDEDVPKLAYASPAMVKSSFPSSQSQEREYSRPAADPAPISSRNDPNRLSNDPAKIPFHQRLDMFKQQDKKEYNNYVKSIRDPQPAFQQRLGPRPFKTRPEQQTYDSGVERDEPRNHQSQAGIPVVDDDDNDPEVVATARGTFDVSGGVLSSVETGVSIVIPRGAIPPGIQQEIYFKVCRELHEGVPPLDEERGERLLSPMVMCGPHGLRFNHPVELRLPHCASMTPDGWSFALKSSDNDDAANQWQNMQLGDQVGQNSVSVLIDHF
ncbi:unnamed protein product [Oikopleura dioica]|uniref:Tight junction protein ZO-1 n=2 Tax=Oikopleura dioica TaxID=34765 RepID=E4WW37_OIKDI|nr:unnamed protein product [Oikopleura dioica]